MIWHSTYIAASCPRLEIRESRDGDGSAHRSQFAQTLYFSLAREGIRCAVPAAGLTPAPINPATGYAKSCAHEHSKERSSHA